jgi:hypothetical protein
MLFISDALESSCLKQLPHLIPVVPWETLLEH